MRILFAVALALFIIPAIPSFAKSIVIEGDDAEKLYAAEKGKAQILVQKNRDFILRHKGKEILKPPSMTAKVGERFYIVNEEHIFVHNVYDTTDSSWVLKKQKPSTAAAITFDAPGKHSLNCAIHPKMKIDVEVVK